MTSLHSINAAMDHVLVPWLRRHQSCSTTDRGHLADLAKATRKIRADAQRAGLL